MVTRLSNIELEEVSLVDRGANKGARVLIWKSDNGRVEKAAFEKHVDEIQRHDNCSRNVALQKARTEHPDEFERYQRDGAVSSRPVEKQALTGDAVRAWNELVARIASDEGISRRAAMRRARREEPLMFEAMQLAS